LETFRNARSFCLAAVPLFVFSVGAQNADAQGLYAQAQNNMVENQRLIDTHAQLAQAPGGTAGGAPQRADIQQFDLTPVKLPERGSAFGNMQNFRTGALYYLPARMFFNATVENSLRLETNVFQTEHNNKPDMIYRVLPNITLGYATSRTSRVATNFFMFRDQYMEHSNQLSRNIYSIGFRGDKDWILSPRTTMTTSFMARELIISRFDELSDLMPSVTVVRRVGQTGAVYASALGQIRWRDVFARFQEGDTFYSIGAVRRTPNWTLVFDTTLIDNFGNKNLRGGVETNHTIVMSMEAARKLSQRLPLAAFIRAEPIFNIVQASRQGYAGVNFRLFGGIRAEISKPAIFPVSLRSG
jgi:hypothetical protein